MSLNRSERHAAGPAVRLDMMSAGERCQVVDVRGGPGMVRRLTAMGIVPGVGVTVVSNARGAGPMIVGVGPGRLGLGRGMARHVLVRPV